MKRPGLNYYSSNRLEFIKSFDCLQQQRDQCVPGISISIALSEAEEGLRSWVVVG